MAAVKDQLSAVRLLTLTGAGGSGKTRLAIEAATDLVDAFCDGVWWVELAVVSDAELLPRAVAKTLGVPGVPNQRVSDTLEKFLRSRQLLLVLDNCEHLVASCGPLVERFCELVEAANPHLGFMLPDAEMDYWLDRLEREQDNLRAAMRWSLRPQYVPPPEQEVLTELGLRLAGLQEELQPHPDPTIGGGGHPNPKIIVHARGELEDGRRFMLHISWVRDVVRAMNIDFISP